MSEEYVLASDVVAVLKLMHREGYCIGNNEAMLRIFEELSNLKMVEAEPVVHAHWIVPDDNYPDTCSNCLFEFVWDGDDDYHPKRCPNCGAHMDEEVAE